MAGHGTTTTTGSRDTKTYNSFTLHTPPPQWQPRDLPHSPAPPSPPASTVHRPPTSHRALRLGLALVSVVLLSALAGGPAFAKSASCADQVVADWYDDGRVGKIYPLECYRQAIKILPPDVLDYSNAKEEIGRALAFAKQGKPDPGGEDPTPPATTSTGTTKTETTKTSTTKTSTTKTEHDQDEHDQDRHDRDRHDRTSTTDTSTTDTSGPSSVPVPLLVLGGLAVLLLAAGSAGYLRRRMDGDGDGDGTPPTTT